MYYNFCKVNEFICCFIVEELALSGHEKHHKSWKDDFEKVIKLFILPEIPCYILYRYILFCYKLI